MTCRCSETSKEIHFWNSFEPWGNSNAHQLEDSSPMHFKTERSHLNKKKFFGYAKCII